MKSEHLFIIRLGDGRHFEYEGTLDGAKRKASKLAGGHSIACGAAACCHTKAVFRLGRQSGVAPLGASREGFLSRAALRSNVRQYTIDM